MEWKTLASIRLEAPISAVDFAPEFREAVGTAEKLRDLRYAQGSFRFSCAEAARAFRSLGQAMAAAWPASEKIAGKT